MTDRRKGSFMAERLMHHWENGEGAVADEVIIDDGFHKMSYGCFLFSSGEWEAYSTTIHYRADGTCESESSEWWSPMDAPDTDRLALSVFGIDY